MSENTKVRYIMYGTNGFVNTKCTIEPLCITEVTSNGTQSSWSVPGRGVSDFSRCNDCFHHNSWVTHLLIK
jgi:hypothetical protein